MFRSKSEVDQYVRSSLQRVKTVKERNLRSYQAAQMYFKVQDYDSAKQYLIMYLSEKDDFAPAHELLGKTSEELGEKHRAFLAYKKSLELDPSQPRVLLKICELLCDKSVEFDANTAKYFLDRASAIFPNDPAVFMLREHLLVANSSATQDDIEKLVLAELKARPADVTVRIRLLKLHLDSKKVDMAYNHVLDVESKQLHSNSFAWYQFCTKIFKAYFDSNPNKCDWKFFMMWISSLDRLCNLSLDDVNYETCDIVTATDAIYTLDQTIYLSTKNVVRAPEIYAEFIKHISAQLTFHLIVLLMKRAKKSSTDLWKETMKMCSPLLLFSACEPINADAAWCLNLSENQRKLLKTWAQQARCRYVQSGHLLKSYEESGKKFLEKVNFFNVDNWRKTLLFEKTFHSGTDDASSSTSYFVTSIYYETIPQKIPSDDDLKPSKFVVSFETNYKGSLHHLVWLGLQYLVNARNIRAAKISSFFRTSPLKNLQFSVTNLHNTGVETLNQLDMDAFLYATIFCTAAVLEDQKAKEYFDYGVGRAILLPANISPTLCSAEQSKWWTSACSISKSGGRGLGNNMKMSDLRHSLQRGIEIIRGDGLPLPIIVCLARTFGMRGSESDSIEESEGCENRSVDLWRTVISVLDRLENPNTSFTSKLTSNTKLFEYPVTDLEPDEFYSIMREGRFFIASYHMRKEQYEKALELFKFLETPEAYFNVATIYQKLAQEQISGLRGEEITSHLRCKYLVLATKARASLQNTRGMIKGDHHNPLHSKVKAKLIEVEDLISRIEGGNGVERDCAESDDSFSLGSGGSPIIVEKPATPLNQHRNQNRVPAAASTPRHIKSQLIQHNYSEMAELMNLQQSTNQLKLQQIMEQSKLILDRTDNIMSEQKSQRNKFDAMVKKFSDLEVEVKTVLADIKKEVKRSDLCNMLDEDDYGDMLPCQNYPPANPLVPSRGLLFPNQRPPVSEPQFAGAVPQYFSPRVDQMYQNSVNFFNGQNMFSVIDGQPLPEYVRSLGQSKFPPQLPSTTLPTPIGPASHLIFSQTAAPMVPNTVGPLHGLLSQPRFAPPVGMGHSSAEQAFGGRGPTNVVMTTSDVLPTGTPPVQPTLSVTIPPQHRLGDTSVAHQFQISVHDGQNVPQVTSKQPLVPSTANTSNTSVTESIESDDDSTDTPASSDVQSAAANPIPLDNNEVVLLEMRAKLYRFDDQAWHERGHGTIRIQKKQMEDKYKIVMRKDKLNTICANHAITAGMNMEYAQQKSVFWVAKDFSEHVMKTENFNARFKTVEEAKEFKKAVDGIVANLKTRKPPTGNDGTENANSSTPSGFGSASNSSPKDKVILAPSRLFPSNIPNSVPQISSSATSAVYSSPISAGSVYGTPTWAPPSTTTTTATSATSLFGGSLTSGIQKNTFSSEASKFTISGTTTTTTVLSTTPATTTSNFGGFTFMKNPTFIATPEAKPDKKVSEVKKTDSPFANFSFSKPSGVESKQSDASKPAFGSESNKPLFSSPAGFSDFGTLAKSAASNQDLSLPKLLSDTNSSTPNPFAGTCTQTPGSIFDQACQPIFKTSPSNITSKADTNSQNNDDDFEPSANFTPAVPMPELVETVSGEENEEALFEERAKLYRYDSERKEWRDRGTGMMKILKTKDTGVIRLLMRRDQVLKVCLNHRLTKDLSISKMKSNPMAYTWIAKDFSEDLEKNGTIQQFSVKFATAEQGLLFEETFKKCQTMEVKSTPKSTDTLKTENKQPPLSSLVVKKAGSWECNSCLVRNDASLTSCQACSTARPGSAPKSSEKPKSTFSFGMPATTATLSTTTTPASQTSVISTADSSKPPLSSLVKKVPGSWNCTACYITNDVKATSCVACQSNRPGFTPSAAPKNQPFSFGIPSSESTKPTNATPAFSFGIPTSDKTVPAKEQSEASWDCKSCHSSNNANLLKCSSCDSSRPVTVMSTAALGSGTTSQAFTFGSFASNLPTTNITNEVTITPVSDSSKTVEGSGFNFGVAKNTKDNAIADESSAGGAPGTKNIFNFGAPEAFGKSTFQFSLSTFNAQSRAAANTSHRSDTSVDEDPSEEHDTSGPHFQPVFPLPDIVAVKSGEEDEHVLYSEHARLFRYDSSAREWKEGGVGDIKILQHKTTGKKRLLMRWEPIKKVCLNHYISDAIELKQRDPKTWLWSIKDYSSGEGSLHTYCLRLKTPDIAKQFYDAVEEAKKSTDLPPEKGAVKMTETDSGSDDDVVYVETLQASDELQKKARSLMLPDNFYLYLQKPPCPGCVGCDNSDDDEAAKLPQNLSKQTTEVKTPTFDIKSVNPFSQKSKKDEAAADSPAQSKVDTPATITQPIFGTAASSFSFSSVGHTFGQNLTSPSTPAKANQSSAQPFFSTTKTSFSPSDSKSSPTSIFGNVNSTTAAPSFISKDMPSFGSLASSSPSTDTPTFGFLAQNANPPAVQPSIFGGTNAPSFLSKDAPSFGSLASSSPSTIGSAGATNAPSFMTKDGPSFGSLASSSPATTETPSSSFIWEGTGTSLFGHLAKAPPAEAQDTEGDDGGDAADPEKESDGIHFSPIIPLPKEIEQSTGEEDEEILFNERAKLFKYNSDLKEWKERGVGMMKILQHKTNNTYRLLMRREQVHKVVCNQRITTDHELKPMPHSETSSTWVALNLAQEYTSPQLETLAVKFSNKDILQNFKSIVNDTIKQLKSGGES